MWCRAEVCIRPFISAMENPSIVHEVSGMELRNAPFATAFCGKKCIVSISIMVIVCFMLERGDYGDCFGLFHTEMVGKSETEYLLELEFVPAAVIHSRGCGIIAHVHIQACR